MIIIKTELKSDTGIFDKIRHAPVNSKSIDKDTVKESSHLNPSKQCVGKVTSNNSGHREIGELKTLVVDITKIMGRFCGMITTRMDVFQKIKKNITDQITSIID